MFCSVVTGAFSQSRIKYEFGEPYKFPKKHREIAFYGNETEGLHQVSMRKGKDIIVQSFKKAPYSLQAEKDIDISGMERAISPERFTVLKTKKYFWLYSYWDRENEKEQLFVRMYDPKSRKLVTKPEKLIQCERLAGSFAGYGVSNKYEFHFSHDSSKVLINYRLKPKERKDALNYDIIGFCVFDTLMKKVWGREIQMPYTEARMDNLGYEIDSKGNVYMLAKIYEDDDNRERRKDVKPRYHYEIFFVPPNAPQMKSINVDLGDKFINAIRLGVDRQENLVCAGYYSNVAASGSTDGVFLFKTEYSKTGNFSGKKTLYEFPKELLTAFESMRSKKKADKKEKKGGDLKAENLYMDEVVFGEDGSTTVTGEEYFTRTYTTYNASNGTTTTRTTYYYQDIIAVKLAADGKIVWANKIPKNQVGGNGRGGMSYFHQQYKGEDYYFYLDNIKNIDLPLTEAPVAHRDGAGGFLTCVRIDKSGKMVKQPVFDSREERVRVFPADFRKVSDKMIVSTLRRKKKNRILSINLS